MSKPNKKWCRFFRDFPPTFTPPLFLPDGFKKPSFFYYWTPSKIYQQFALVGYQVPNLSIISKQVSDSRSSGFLVFIFVENVSTVGIILTRVKNIPYILSLISKLSVLERKGEGCFNRCNIKQ